MLFFKQIKDDKLSDKAFRVTYDRECHLCSVTVNAVAELEESPAQLENTLAELDIPASDYMALKAGDRCNPDQVKKLCRHSGIPGPGENTPCPRLNNGQSSTKTEG